MKLGILGTGMIVKDLLTTFNQLNIEKAYILGTLQTRVETEQLVQQYHLAGCYYDYNELLKSDVDTIYIALPNHLHYSFAKKALENHKHVIVEKPITSNAMELKELIGIAKREKKIMIEAMNIHYLPAYQSLQKQIDQLGKIKIVSFNYSQYSSRYNAFKKGNILPAFDYHKSGGALMDINVYNIHGIVGLFGRPKSIQYSANIENHIDTSGILTLDYDTFKAIAIGAKDCQAPIVSTIQGDAGYIRMTMPINSLREYTLSDNQGYGQQYSFDKTTHRLFYEFQEFIRIIEEQDNAKAQQMLDISLIVSEIMQEARQQERIVFDNDK